MNTIDGIKSVFKLKLYKTEITDMYLCATIQTAETDDGSTCWTMSYQKYVKAAVDNV